MKKLFAGILTLSLVLAACGNSDDSKKADEHKDKDKTTQESNNSKKDDSKSKKDDKAEKDSKSDDKNASTSADSSSSDSNSSDKATSNSSSSNASAGTEGNSADTTGNSDGNSQNNQQAAQTDNASQNQGAANATNASADARQNANTTQTGYVAPYQGQNAVPAASTIVQAPANNQDALKHLPNFPQSLTTAQNEANALNGQQNAYNDYGIDSLGNGTYSYVFSFANQAQPGMYTIVSVNQKGEASVIDPAYNGQQ